MNSNFKTLRKGMLYTTILIVSCPVHDSGAAKARDLLRMCISSAECKASIPV